MLKIDFFNEILHINKLTLTILHLQKTLKVQ